MVVNSHPLYQLSYRGTGLQNSMSRNSDTALGPCRQAVAAVYSKAVLPMPELRKHALKVTCPQTGRPARWQKGKGLEAGAGALQSTAINDLARGGTISSSAAFRNIPGPSVPPKKARRGRCPCRTLKACVCSGRPHAIPGIYNLFVENTRNVHVPLTVVGFQHVKNRHEGGCDARTGP